MLTHLLAFGILGAAGGVPAQVGAIVALDERTISFVKGPTPTGTGTAIPLGAVRIEESFDPSDRVPLAMKWDRLLAPGEKVASIVRLTMLARGAELGIEIDQSADRLPIIGEDGKTIQIWTLCRPEEQFNAAFSGTGVDITIAAQIRTDSVPYKQIERSIVQTWRQG